MNKILKITLCTFIFLCVNNNTSAKQWSLKDCINYALTHNIALQKKTLQLLSAYQDTKHSKANLFPSLTASTSQNTTYRPWTQSGIASGGYLQASVDKVFYNGAYSINTNYTIWNGGKNINTVKLNKIIEQQTKLDSAEIANKLIEQIMLLYTQILYAKEAIEVNKSALETSKQNEIRGEELVKVQKMSRADMAQLRAQRATDQYNVVEAKNNFNNYKRQLKELLQLITNEEFEVSTPQLFFQTTTHAIPNVNDVYTAAINNRPEIKNTNLSITSSKLNIQLAKANKMPVVGLTAGIATSTTSMSNYKWGKQLKNNFDIGAGITISVPLFDNRQTKTAINKAILQKQNYMLELKDKQTLLYSTIENYWLQATNNQQRLKAAKENTKSAHESYQLLKAKFDERLINIVELMKGKDRLIAAQQNELQAKYLTLLNIHLLLFYKNGTIDFY